MVIQMGYTYVLGVDTLNNTIFIGTAGWSYPGGKNSWNNIFYPPGTADELGFYSRVFNCVEVNSTFYRLMSPSTARSWVQRVPHGFYFTVKLWNRLTHGDLKGKDAAFENDVTSVSNFLRVLQTANTLGCLIMQFPPRFHYSRGNAFYLEKLLELFSFCPVAVELRHHSWSDNMDVLKRMRNKYNFTIVITDEPRSRSSFRPPLYLYVQQDFLYLRFHGRNRNAWWEDDPSGEGKRYDYFYTRVELQPFVRMVKRALSRNVGKVFVIFNNHPRGQAPANAIMFMQMSGVSPPFVPPGLITHYPEICQSPQSPG